MKKINIEITSHECDDEIFKGLTEDIFMTHEEARAFDLNKAVKDGNLDSIHLFIDYLSDLYLQNLPSKLYLSEGVYRLFTEELGRKPEVLIINNTKSGNPWEEHYIEVNLFDGYQGEALFFNWDNNSQEFWQKISEFPKKLITEVIDK